MLSNPAIYFENRVNRNGRALVIREAISAKSAPNFTSMITVESGGEEQIANWQLGFAPANWRCESTVSLNFPSRLKK